MTECGRCGDCCESIYIPVDPFAIIVAMSERTQQDLDFIRAHWHPIHDDVDDHEQQRYACDAFDPETRLCTAHDDRPPVCRGYPWYGSEPDDRPVPARCSFATDAPWRTVLPIVSVRHAGVDIDA